MRREVIHWQEAAARATAETARVAREAEAFKDGCRHGREDVISIMPLLVAAQQNPAEEARASGDQRSGCAPCRDPGGELRERPPQRRAGPAGYLAKKCRPIQAHATSTP